MVREGFKRVVFILVIVFLFTGLSFAEKQEKAATDTKVKKEVKKSDAKKAALTLGTISGNTISINLDNAGPVRGIQCTLSGVKVTELRTTSRAAGFLAKFNEANGRIIMVSTSEDKIAAGKGAIAEIVYEKNKDSDMTDINLSEITIVGEGKKVLKSSN